MATIPANPPHAAAFDAARWLADWTEYGGIYILAGNQIILRRSSPLSYWSTQALDALRDEMLRSGGGPAIADHLLRRREGLV
jgi:hypothetical protein